VIRLAPGERGYVARMSPGTPSATTRATARTTARRRRPAAPTLRMERRLLRDGAVLLASMDEVGRGAPAGPVAVGVVVVHATTPPAPPGVRDSKLLSAAAREALAPVLERWAVDTAVGTAGADEVDDHGVVGALRLAGRRALASLRVAPDLVLLDGSHDWLTEPAPASGRAGVPVVTRVRADLTCASVAGASILAKVHRDGVMAGLDAAFPGYGWAANKGYGTADHLEALERLGPTSQHRISWNLPVRRAQRSPGAPTSAPAPSAGRAPARR